MKKLKLNIFKENTATLTGHRPKYLPWGYNETKLCCVKFKSDLKDLLEQSINSGITYFLTGMAEGFDMIATEILIKLRETYKHIKIFAIIPYLNQDIKWTKQQRERYGEILKQCDMITNSSLCIACFNGKPSGTSNTVKFAVENGCKIRIINPDNYKSII
ncbi:MAG: SLOG family protein [Candidatus Onthoplasma sp.]